MISGCLVSGEKIKQKKKPKQTKNNPYVLREELTSEIKLLKKNTEKYNADF